MLTTTPKPLYLCLCGLSGAGKDTVGDYLERAHGFHRVAIADPLKRHVQQLFDLSDDQLWGEQRNTPHARLGRTPRELYQVFGDMCRNLDPEIWIRLWCDAVGTALANGHSVVCTDLRTLPELQAARARGARVWRVLRPGAGAPGCAGEHRTERALAELADGHFDRCIRNDGDLARLHRTIASALAADDHA